MSHSYCVVLIATIVFFLSCKKEKSPASTPIEPKAVYVTGFTRNSAGNDETIVWKNGIKQVLQINNSLSNSIYIAGKDVYVAGQVKNTATNKWMAVLWKNGTLSNLTDGTAPFAAANAVFISGADIYVAGTIQQPSFTNNAVYWKNGALVTLSTGTIAADVSNVNGMSVSGADVYVAGTILKNTGGYAVAIWKNGVIFQVSSGSSDFLCTGLFVSGTDVYVTANEDDGTNPGKPRLWKNGTPVTLSYPAANGAVANCVFVNGNDVYVGGYVVNASTGEWNARYWKNGSLVSLPDGPKSSVVKSMYVDGNDVYAAGVEEDAARKRIARLWKNSTASTLSEPADARSEALAVFVK